MYILLYAKKKRNDYNFHKNKKKKKIFINEDAFEGLLFDNFFINDKDINIYFRLNSFEIFFILKGIQ